MSDPVVEELLEKGARAIYERNGDGGWDRDGWDGVSSEMKGIYRNLFAAGLDAVFPGWREGITREWGTRMPNGNVCEWPHEVSARRAYKASKRFPDGEHPLVSRWLGPWVPVEDRTT